MEGNVWKNVKRCLEQHLSGHCSSVSSVALIKLVTKLMFASYKNRVIILTTIMHACITIVLSLLIGEGEDRDIYLTVVIIMHACIKIALSLLIGEGEDRDIYLTVLIIFICEIVPSFAYFVAVD